MENYEDELETTTGAKPSEGVEGLRAEPLACVERNGGKKKGG